MCTIIVIVLAHTQNNVKQILVSRLFYPRDFSERDTSLRLCSRIQQQCSPGSGRGNGEWLAWTHTHPWHYLMWKSYKASCGQQVHFMASSITTLSLLIVLFFLYTSAGFSKMALSNVTGGRALSI